MAWYNSSWKYRVKITVDHSKVGSDLTDFPVYVDLSTLPSGFHTNVKSDGGDIRVTRSDGTTECPREVVFYDSTNDKGELHFKANSLSSTTDTVFYIYYGNSSATEPAVDSTYGRNAVWSNYKAVYHMNQDPTGTVIDSSGNTPFNANVDLDSNDLTTGKLGSGIKKDTGEYFRNATGISFSSGSNVTFQAWMYPTGKGAGANPGIWRAGNTSTGTEAFNILNGTTRRPWVRWAATDILKPTTGYQIPENEWTLTHWVVASNSSVTFYANGSSRHTASHSKITPAFTIYNFGWQYSLTEEVLGTYDEVRFMASTLSADWVSAEYTNQATPTTFYTVGTQEAGSTEANSIRGLYILGKNTGNSYRTLYIQGSQVLSTDYFNVVFSEPSISDFSERSLYLQGSLSSNSERGLLLEGKPVIDERGLYLLGYIRTSSTRDLYLGGIDTGTSERNLYTQGTSSSTSNRSFYIQGSISTNNERGLYLIGKSLEGERELYLHGFETGSSEKKLYLEGANVGYDNRGLYIQGYLSDSSSRGLYLYGYGVGTPERALHIAGVGLGASERGVCVEGKDIDVSERGLYIQGSLEDGSNRKLYLEGYISANIERTLYIQGQETLSSSMPLYIWGYEVGSFERNLYIQGYDIKSLSRGLYIQGYLSDNSDRELYLFGYDIETSERGLYLVGLDLGTSERSIYLESKDMGASERDLYVHGFVRSFSNRGLYIVGEGEVPFHEGNVIIKIDEGLYLNPKTGRIYVAIE